MLGGCLLLTVVSAAVGIKVTIPQPQYEVARGDNVTLPCNFEPENPDYPLIVVSWSTLADRPGIKGTPVATFFDPPGTLDVSPQFEKRITMRKDVEERRVDLILTDVTLLENKVFECEVKIPGDDTGTLAATTRLVVLVAPSKPVCKIQGKTEYGQNINLTCLSEEGSPTPQYSWQRYNVQNQPTPLPPRTTDKKGILSLYNVSMETSGYFICTSQNKIRSATCNMTLTVLPPSMNIGSTAGIIGGCVAALLVLVIIIYCCCRRKKEESKEYPEGIPEETPFRDVESKPGEGEYRDDKRSNPSDTMGGRSPRGQIESEDRPEERICSCGAVEVRVEEERMFSPLFEEVVLRCSYSSRSAQPAVVQWWFKSYCRDRTADAFGFPQDRPLFLPQRLLSRHSEHVTPSHLDCGMDLRIARLQWEDSGVYHCKVVISDDPEGTNEAQVELLVLGKVGAIDDLLPGFDLDIMPDWVFVALVILSGCCCLLLVGICWCQCCPHSCCCYLPCCCCRGRCCCPIHLYEAGKAVRSDPLFISGVPTMLPIVPPSVIQPKTEKNVTGASSMSEFSCFDSESSSQSSQVVHKKAVPAVSDQLGALSFQLSPPHKHQAEDPCRWNPRSEHLQRKALPGSGCGEGLDGRTGSLDELEAFALSYAQRGCRRGESRWLPREIREQRQQGTRHAPQDRRRSADQQESSLCAGVSEHTFPLDQGQGRWGQGDWQDTPSKTSLGKSSDCYLSISPRNQPGTGVPLQSFCEMERFRIAPPPLNPTNTPKMQREEPGNRRNAVSYAVCHCHLHCPGVLGQ
ncbi:hypothetical protein GJAV_G00254010 [Gymnothorax javanicus]|nr:hypothetical protein GJAV_G00254010 [Gymnothorax javanicus]